MVVRRINGGTGQIGFKCLSRFYTNVRSSNDRDESRNEKRFSLAQSFQESKFFEQNSKIMKIKFNL